MADSRYAALIVLEKCRRVGAWSDAVLGNVMDAEGLDGRDRALAVRLCYGVLQDRMLLDHVIGQCSSLPIKKIEPKVLDILRLSTYQLLRMDRIPPAAAVDSAVSLSRRLGYARASGFVNAVLRRISEGAYSVPDGDSPMDISIRYSHPLWLTERLIDLFGREETETFFRCNNEAVPVTVQTNTLKTDTKTLLSALKAQGIDAKTHPFVPDCILLQTASVQTIPEFRRGEFYVQDAAAKLAILAAGPQRGMRILDACAAPGGKSFAAAIASGGAEITACDLHEKKLQRIREGVKRLGLHGIGTLSMDARTPCPEFAERFDLVIADVPCSGLGVIRKKPDIRYKDPAALAALPQVQLAILRNVSSYVKPGGTLLYSTCTILPEENDEICTAFLKDHPQFAVEDFTLPDGSGSSGGMLQLWPQRHGTDGFFIAKMKKWTELT